MLHASIYSNTNSYIIERLLKIGAKYVNENNIFSFGDDAYICLPLPLCCTEHNYVLAH